MYGVDICYGTVMYSNVQYCPANYEIYHSVQIHVPYVEMNKIIHRKVFLPPHYSTGLFNINVVGVAYFFGVMCYFHPLSENFFTTTIVPSIFLSVGGTVQFKKLSFFFRN